MAFLPSSLRSKTANTKTIWGHTFEWSSDHLTEQQVAPLRQSYDTLADDALEQLESISQPQPQPQPHENLPPSQDPQPRHSDPAKRDEADATPSKIPSEATATEHRTRAAAPPKRDLVALLREHHDSDPVLSRLWEEATTVPEWVDWAQISRGQDVFYRYSGASVNGLAFQSLVGGMGAWRVVEVLARTGGFRTSVARNRLYETTQYVLQVTQSVASILPPGVAVALVTATDGEDEASKGEASKAGLDGGGDGGGDGWAASIRVRLLHAAVRRRILALESKRAGYYDVNRFGVPINDLDCIGTIASFSASLIWLSFPRQGILLRQHEIDDYIALWRYVAYLVGAPTTHFASAAQAKAIMESLLLLEVQPSRMSGTLARNVIEALSAIPPTYASREFLSATCRWLLGAELCDELGIMRPPVYYWILVLGQCLFFMTINYTYRSVEAWDRGKINLMKRGMWRWIVESPHGLAGNVSEFDFKYVPRLGKTTGFESASAGGLIPKGIERRNLITFGVFGGMLAVSSLVGWRVVVGLVRLVVRY